MKVILCCSVKVENHKRWWGEHMFYKKDVFDMEEVHVLSFQAFSYTWLWTELCWYKIWYVDETKAFCQRWIQDNTKNLWDREWDLWDSWNQEKVSWISHVIWQNERFQFFHIQSQVQTVQRVRKWYCSYKKEKNWFFQKICLVM